MPRMNKSGTYVVSTGLPYKTVTSWLAASGDTVFNNGVEAPASGYYSIAGRISCSGIEESGHLQLTKNDVLFSTPINTGTINGVKFLNVSSTFLNAGDYIGVAARKGSSGDGNWNITSTSYVEITALNTDHTSGASTAVTVSRPALMNRISDILAGVTSVTAVRSAIAQRTAVTGSATSVVAAVSAEMVKTVFIAAEHTFTQAETLSAAGTGSIEYLFQASLAATAGRTAAAAWDATGMADAASVVSRTAVIRLGGSLSTGLAVSVASSAIMSRRQVLGAPTAVAAEAFASMYLVPQLNEGQVLRVVREDRRMTVLADPRSVSVPVEDRLVAAGGDVWL